jgi:hypothetical protein
MIVIVIMDNDTNDDENSRTDRKQYLSKYNTKNQF